MPKFKSSDVKWVKKRRRTQKQKESLLKARQIYQDYHISSESDENIQPEVVPSHNYQAEDIEAAREAQADAEEKL